MKLSKFAATQLVSKVRRHEEGTQDAPTEAERRWHKGQAEVNRHALAAHGWEIVYSNGIACDVKRPGAVHPSERGKVL